MKHTGKQLCTSLLIKVLEKVLRLKSDKWGFELFCLSFKDKLYVNTAVYKHIFETSI